MRRLAWFVSLLALSLASCGKNPLLLIADSNYAPVKVGDQWSYVGPSALAFTRKVVLATSYMGRPAYQVDTIESGVTSTAYVAINGSELDVYQAALGWTLARKLPYVIGNRWVVPGTDPTRQDTLYVDGNEGIVTPAGTYSNCFRLRQQTDFYAGGLTTTSTTAYIWAAPDVGDVQTASVDLSGTSTVTSQLSSFTAGP